MSTIAWACGGTRPACPRKRGHGTPRSKFGKALAIVLLFVCCSGEAEAQVVGHETPAASRFTLSEQVLVDTLSRAVEARLDRVAEYLAEEQWEEAVETIRQVMEEADGRLIEVAPGRYIRGEDYCRLRLVKFPPPALSLYRRRIDPVAGQWYEQGVANRDRDLLSKVVEQAFASSVGDDALNALAEMSLEEADHATARHYWEKIIPLEGSGDQTPTWLAYPDTDLDLASIRARLVMVSILEGDLERAARELDALERLHPNESGRFGGVEVVYVESLRQLLAESRMSPDARSSPDWLTFGGVESRNGLVSEPAGLGPIRWRRELPESLSDQRLAWSGGRTTRRVAEDPDRPLSYHPVVVDDLLLLNSMTEIFVLDARSGKPAWGASRAAVFRDRFDAVVQATYLPADTWGVPRFTMSTAGQRVYARMGSPVTTVKTTDGASPPPSGYLACLDLEAEGRLCWTAAPDEPGWAYDGTPLADEENVYVVMRRNDIRPQIYVVCLDAATGKRRWRRLICAAETITQGRLHEVSHTLLTRHKETLYLNTNLGAIASIACEDGRLRWVSLYPRVRSGSLLQPEEHWLRDLNPCLYWRGLLLVAPSDSKHLLALDALTGQILWQSQGPLEEVVHLLGAVGEYLIVAGRRLYWIGLDGEDAGRIVHMWPESEAGPGFGRGVIAGGVVYWPTRERVLMFDAVDARLKGQFSLVEHGITGGNLVVADGRMFVVDGRQVVALGGK